jgi:hypothetical protein
MHLNRTFGKMIHNYFVSFFLQIYIFILIFIRFFNGNGGYCVLSVFYLPESDHCTVWHMLNFILGSVKRGLHWKICMEIYHKSNSVCNMVYPSYPSTVTNVERVKSLRYTWYICHFIYIYYWNKQKWITFLCDYYFLVILASLCRLKHMNGSIFHIFFPELLVEE